MPLSALTPAPARMKIRSVGETVSMDERIRRLSAWFDCQGPSDGFLPFFELSQTAVDIAVAIINKCRRDVAPAMAFGTIRAWVTSIFRRGFDKPLRTRSPSRSLKWALISIRHVW